METITRPHHISRKEAIEQIGRYKKEKKKLLADAYKNKNVLPTCETFARSAMEDLLAQPGCAYIRVYYALNDKDDVHLVLVGADADGKDIVPAADTSLVLMRTAGSDGVIIENGVRCPSDCPPPSPLNP